MAWTETSDCLFCGREISILRKIGNGQFCSKAHEEQFKAQQNQLAVEVLHRTHDALKAYRPTGSSIEDILGTPRQPESVASTTPPAPVISAPVSREFDVAAPALLASLAKPAPVEVLRPIAQMPPAPMARETFHYGESLAKLATPRPVGRSQGFIPSMKRLWAYLWNSGQSQRA